MFPTNDSAKPSGYVSENGHTQMTFHLSLVLECRHGDRHASKRKYMGDVLLQKTYTDSNYNRHPNTGEKDQYYYKDNHEAIISREDFAKTQDLIDERAKMKCKG